MGNLPDETPDNLMWQARIGIHGHDIPYVLGDVLIGEVQKTGVGGATKKTVQFV